MLVLASQGEARSAKHSRGLPCVPLTTIVPLADIDRLCSTACPPAKLYGVEYSTPSSCLNYVVW